MYLSIEQDLGAGNTLWQKKASEVLNTVADE
jgi:hypothetical protein